MKIKTLPVSFKAGPEDGLNEGEFIVYPSTFTREPDSYGDVVAPGAFAEGIAKRKEAGVVLPGLFAHRLDDPDFYIASALSEEEDDHGWRIHGVFDPEPKAQKVYGLVKSGRVRELSFAFDTLEEGAVELEDGRKANELRKLETFEFSFVPIGANRDTSVVAVKANALAILDGLKAGRVLSAKNESELRAAYDSIGRVLDTLGNQDDDKANGPASSVKVEAGSAGKAEDQMPKFSSAKTRLLIDLALREAEIS